MKNVIVIPARFKSGRFPGKPLALINKKSLIYRTWSIAKSIHNIDEVFIATDDFRIEEHALDFGAKVVMTSEDCTNGTERVFEALNVLNIKPQVIINLQGDAPLTPPSMIQTLLNTMISDSSIGFATLATGITLEQYQVMLNLQNRGQSGGTTVVFDKHHSALYFSKRLIPFFKEINTEPLPIYRHIGIYAYRYETLKEYLDLPMLALEKLEGLEQLRALENGIPIHVVPVESKGHTDWDVNNPEDIEIVEDIIKREGELVPALLA